ncbi:MAG: 16S rRNA (cytidine(1402)-2'-O)-methyltransferase [Lachnospiraceae bacterium]|nr:16S rRNA (cytidine(1402)-2'-O)-methyltransferase [Lachnospiraceae bacterium]
MRPGERLDYLERGDYHIIQQPQGFCFGIDAVLLSGFVKVHPSERLADLGTGTGILPLLLHAKTACRDLTGVEAQADSAEMAARSVRMNGLEEDIHILQADVATVAEQLGAQSFDVVVTNPPYMRGGSGKTNNSDRVTMARHETTCDLAAWMTTAATLLKENGRIYIIHRPNRLAELMQCMQNNRLEPKQLRMVQSYTGQKPVLVLVEGVKGAKPDLNIREPLIIYRQAGVYTDEVLQIYGKDLPEAGGERDTELPAEREAGGGLVLVGTPIGNLSDFSPRAAEALRQADMVAAEDTRHSLRLLQHIGIRAKLTSYHEFNKIEKATELVRLMQRGHRIALITDAGMPGISDPGEELVRLCYRAGVSVTVVPGPSAVVSALVMSGLSTRYFHFEGFLPKDKKEKRERLAALQQLTDTLVLYEAPHRLTRTLAELLETLGDRQLVTVRELTKVFEERRAGSISEQLRYYREQPPRGEFVLVIEGRSWQDMRGEERMRWDGMTIPEHVAMYEAQGLSQKEAMKAVAKDRGTAKRDIYAVLHREAE